jgi:hypothetical protein
VDILSVCLNQFDFSSEQTKETEQYLCEIINSLCVLNEMSLLGAVQNKLLKNMSKMAAIKVDQAVNEFNLFSKLLKILDTASDPVLLHNTWKLIGQLCCCEYTLNNVQKFMITLDDNLIVKVARCFTTQK